MSESVSHILIQEHEKLNAFREMHDMFFEIDDVSQHSRKMRNHKDKMTQKKK